MTEERLPTHIWVEAKIRECHAANKPAFVIRKGNKTGGLVLLKSNNLQGTCTLYVQQRDLDGNLGWINPLNEPISEAEADNYISNETEFDSDLWVLEVEDPNMTNPFIDITET